MCHRCEARLEPVPGRPRDKRCPKCGDVNRDENASKNLERVFLEWVRVRQRPEYLRRPGEVANGAASGTADGAANGTADGTADGTASGTASGTAKRKANGTAKRKANSTADGTANGTAKRTANGTANGTASGTAKRKASGTAKREANGTAKGRVEADSGSESEVAVERGPRRTPGRTRAPPTRYLQVCDGGRESGGNVCAAPKTAPRTRQTRGSPEPEPDATGRGLSGDDDSEWRTSSESEPDSDSDSDYPESGSESD